MKTLRWFVLLLFAALAVFGVWRLLSSPGADTLVLYGNVDQRQVELAFMDAERVAEVLVEEGATVEPGQVLARLETRRLRDRMAVLEAQVAEAAAALARLENGTRPEEIAQARASVAAARADLDYAEKQYRRVAGILRDSGGKGVRRSELDEAVSRRDAAQARLTLERNGLRLAEIGPRREDIDRARAALRERQNSLAQLRNQLDDAELKSPSRSVVNRRLLEPGDMASPQRAVFSLAVLSPKWVRAYVAEPDLGRVRQGMRALVHTDSFPEAVPGTVGFIASVAEFTPKTVETAQLRTSLVYEIRIYVEDREDRLRLGMPATVTLSGEGADR
ncbi:MAG: HlyD family efflux transporter periplasmic adaptor subunit [Desulfovibrio sp.]|nr:HlyD family efflux transporter periplasmic adaptor subunit [Desulfovibrio sp.]